MRLIEFTCGLRLSTRLLEGVESNRFGPLALSSLPLNTIHCLCTVFSFFSCFLSRGCHSMVSVITNQTQPV